ncbi:MAG: hypothetical protein K9I85_09995 [Saprospiraceae bacterium]|nr:hypothetical protein [Saprospiraceae bacterium]
MEQATLWQGQETRGNAVFALILTLMAWAVVSFFHLEDQLALEQLMPIVVGGFVIHSLLPRSYRMTFFVLLTVLSALILFGFMDGLILVGIAMAMIGITYLPVGTGVRQLLVLGAGVILALFKSGQIPQWAPSNVVTIVASLFMFRMIIYLYELKYEKTPTPLITRLAYFFLLPNLVFPIFPVVDFQTFKRTYYNQEESSIYLRGTRLMARGIFHLLLYRLIYTYALPSIQDVDNIFTLLHYIILSYVLILRLSGIFHFAIGILCLFGFNLPEVFNNYFLATGFEDYWQRIHVYWKDFIQKIFYYPIYFKIKHWGVTTSVVITTLIVFAINWLLHSYQWFWVLGQFSFRSNDVAFWMIFGILVASSALIKILRKTHPSKNPWVVAFSGALKITGTFLTIAFLWSLWVSPSLSLYFSTLGIARTASFQDIMILLGIAGAIIGLGAVFHYYYHKTDSTLIKVEERAERFNPYSNFLFLLFLIILGSATGANYVENKTGFVMAPVLMATLNKDDQSTQFQGYYDEILTANNFSSPLWQVQNKQPADWVKIEDAEIIRSTQDILMKELIPSSSTTFKGALLTTNQWGIRDKEYTLLPPPNTTRLVFIGGSIEMGSGVKNEQVFENLVEEKLNEKNKNSGQAYEILNFSVGARSLIQNLYNLEKNVLPFKPDYVVFFNHDREWDAIMNVFSKVTIRRKVQSFPYEEMNVIMEKEGLTPDMGRVEIKKKLAPYMEEIFTWSYARIAKICQENNIKVIWVNIPSVNHRQSVEPKYEDALRWATQAGFDCINLENVFKDYKQEEVEIAPGDNHPNILGHQLIADKLAPALKEILK